MKTSKTLYDLNSLLIVANILIYILIVYLYYRIGGNEYVNIFTVVLAGIFALANIGMLSYEKSIRNPFILILVLVATVFYIARIVTLLHIPFSLAFQRSNIIAEDCNYAIVFIILSNASMLLGFHMARGQADRQESTITIVPINANVRKPIMLLFALFLVVFLGIFQNEIFSRLSGFVTIFFFNQYTILLLTVTFLVYHWHKLTKRSRWLFIVLFLAYGLLTTLTGSRSAILTIGTLLLVGTLAVKRRIMVSRKVILISIIIIPIAILLFITATYKRQLGIKEGVSVEHLRTVNELDLFNIDNIDNHLKHIYDRMGFLDYSTEVIARRQILAEIINVPYYIKSIIDNTLTPGFNIFHTPKVANAFNYVATGQPIPTQEETALEYHSDMLGIYGEYYVLFHGYLALAAFFVAAFMFQSVLIAIKTRNALLTCLYRALLVYIFLNWVNSFGTDWVVNQVIGVVTTTFLFARYFVSHGKRKSVLKIESKKDVESFICKVT